MNNSFLVETCTRRISVNIPIFSNIERRGNGNVVAVEIFQQAWYQGIAAPDLSSVSTGKRLPIQS